MGSNFIKDENSQYGEGIMLDEYQGRISIVNAREGEDGKIWKEWVCPVHKKQPKLKQDGSPVMLPSGIRLGTPEQAIATLKKLLSMVEVETGRSDPPYPDGDCTGDDIPFS